MEDIDKRTVANNSVFQFGVLENFCETEGVVMPFLRSSDEVPKRYIRDAFILVTTVRRQDIAAPKIIRPELEDARNEMKIRRCKRQCHPPNGGRKWNYLLTASPYSGENSGDCKSLFLHVRPFPDRGY